ncbi:MAG: PspC domain-containing protein [Actinomycetes bacterium]|jgi:phage shock protein PspC (stress-responsive transcriptional regulator)|nr:PspC domain-containing protein [Actinomycetes bacterium]
MEPNNKPPLNTILLIVGIALIAFGGWTLMPIAFGQLWEPIRQMIFWGSKLIWPLAVIAVGVFVVYLASTNQLQKPQQNYVYPVGERRLTRDLSRKWIAGVCAGLARYFGIDVTIVRIVVAIAFVVAGFWPVGAAYLIAWLVIPEG